MTTFNNHKAESTRLIRRKEVQAKTGLGASSIYALMSEGKFPKPITLSIRRVAWIESDIDLWIAERIASHKTEMEA
ncbi:helix-turn-helix transcriptional regulator [Acinetobacter sp. 22323]|jgi:prophage regulatory protein|uniref:helix-turn-helix transcriptional regulator n=1 Tax=Acinetobacter sp. 22323 TaxID=3453910 RepID=UPI003F865669